MKVGNYGGSMEVKNDGGSMEIAMVVT